MNEFTVLLFKSGVVVALISMMSSILVSIIQNKYSIKHLKEIIDTRITALNDESNLKMAALSKQTDIKIEALTQEVKKHNNFAERVPRLEEKVNNLEHDK